MCPYFPIKVIKRINDRTILKKGYCYVKNTVIRDGYNSSIVR